MSIFSNLEKINTIFSAFGSAKALWVWIGGGAMLTAICGYLAFVSNAFVNIFGKPLAIIFGSMITIILIMMIYFLYLKIKYPKAEIKETIEQESIKLQEIIRHHFYNETIILDGKKLISCQFDNCTLQYNGGDFTLDDSIMAEGCKVKLTTKEAVATLHLIAATKLLNQNNKLTVIDKYGRIVKFDVFEK